MDHQGSLSAGPAGRTKEHLTPQELSDYWSGIVKVKTLANWRAAGRGPKFKKLGQRVVYDIEDVKAYESATSSD